MILRRFPFLSGVLVGVLAALFVLGNLDVWLRAADAQVPFGAFRIMDGTHTQLARVDHTGALATSATVTVTTDNVNVFHQSTMAHVSSVTHVQVSGSGTPTQSLPVRCVNTAGTTFEACGGAGAAADAVNVFHQSTIRHISSVTHVAGYGAFHIQGLGTPGQSHAGVLTIQGITGMNAVVVSQATAANLQVTATQTGTYAVTQSGTWTVQPGNTANTTAWLVNTGPQMTVAHVTSVTHVSGLVSIRDDNCPTCRMRIDHYNVLVVQPHISGALRTWQVSQCGTTASTAINSNANRRDLWVMNRGSATVFIGYGAQGHVALTTDNGWPLHQTASSITATQRHSTALSIVYLQNYQGPLACISSLGGQTLQVMEILR